MYSSIGHASYRPDVTWNSSLLPNSTRLVQMKGLFFCSYTLQKQVLSLSLMTFIQTCLQLGVGVFTQCTGWLCGTAAHNGTIVIRMDDTWMNVEYFWNEMKRTKLLVSQAKSVPVLLFSSQTPHGLPWEQTWDPTVRIWWLTTWAVAWPKDMQGFFYPDIMHYSALT